MGSENRRGIPPQATVEGVFMPLMRKNERLKILLSDEFSKEQLLRRASGAISTLTPAGKQELAAYLLTGLVSREDNWDQTQRTFSLSLLERIPPETVPATKITDSYLGALDVLGETNPQIENATALFDAGKILSSHLAADPEKHSILIEKWNTITEMLPDVHEKEELEGKVAGLRTTLAFQYIDDTFDQATGKKLKEIFPYLIDKNKTYTKIAQELSIPRWDVNTLSNFLREEGLLEYRKKPSKIKVFSQKLKTDESVAGSSPELPLLKLPARAVDLAEASGLSLPTIRALQRGYRVRIVSLKRFIVGARSLGATAEDLLPYEARLQELQKEKQIKEQQKKARMQSLHEEKRKERAEKAASAGWKSSQNLAEASGLKLWTIGRIKQGGSASEQSLEEFIRGAEVLGATPEDLAPYVARLQSLQSKKREEDQQRKARRQAVQNQERKEPAVKTANEPWKSSQKLAEASELKPWTIRRINRGGSVGVESLEEFIRAAKSLGATAEDLEVYEVRLQSLQSRKRKDRSEVDQHESREIVLLSVTRVALAEASGLTQMTIRCIMRGKPVRIESLAKFIKGARSLGATHEDLLPYVERFESLQEQKREKQTSKKRSVTRVALAEASGINQETIRRIQLGYPVRIKSLAKFIDGARVLGVAPEDIALYEVRLQEMQKQKELKHQEKIRRQAIQNQKRKDSSEVLATRTEKLPQSETIWERNQDG